MVLPETQSSLVVIWTFKGITFENANETTAVFALTGDDVPETLRQHWKFGFKLFYTVSLLSAPYRLRTSLRVDNIDTIPWEFTALLHTYFKIPDVNRIGVVGLNRLTYNDKTLGGQSVEETNERIKIQAEVDRVYLQVKSEVLIDETVEYGGDLSGGRIGLFKIRKSSSMTDVVVWNLWEEKAKAMADMGDEDYKGYICVEVGAVDPFIKLSPKESWEGFQIIECLLD
ncbi:hypothetical protein HK096_006820 [Nowakowskiella sp. JEL0078]|nr:hypothetical protein HK096_006820 [Nowakowskiella sp. JEL0078]